MQCPVVIGAMERKQSRNRERETGLSSRCRIREALSEEVTFKVKPHPWENWARQISGEECSRQGTSEHKGQQKCAWGQAIFVVEAEGDAPCCGTLEQDTYLAGGLTAGF